MSWQTKVLPAAVLLIVLVLTWRGWRIHRLRRRFADPLPQEYPYRARTSLLSPGELAFYRVLLDAVAGRYAVCCKVRLADVLDCRPAAWGLGYGRLIAQKHLDFVLVDRETTRIVAAVELDDRSHARPKRGARDEFVNRAAEAAGVRLHRVRAAANYDSRKVRELLCI